MTFDAYRDAVLADARVDAERTRAQGRAEAEHRLAQARSEADRIVEDGRRRGREDAARALPAIRVAAQREARERVLRARREAYEAARELALARLAAQPAAVREALTRRLGDAARAAVGSDARVEVDAEHGGITAASGDRRVDYRFPSLVAQALDGLGGRLEELWQ